MNEKWDDRMIMESYEVIATLSSMERETTPDGAMRSFNRFRIEPRLGAKRKMLKVDRQELPLETQIMSKNKTPQPGIEPAPPPPTAT